MTGPPNVRILGGLIGIDHDRTTNGVEQLVAVDDALIFIESVENGSGEWGVLSPSIFDRF